MEEDDSERSMLLEKISDLLLSGGYFRAQISNLSPFDKLTGGLAWSITASNVDVDFDVLYDDDATLGYKIKVGEAIEAALQTMECPYPLQAHQIQGLDYPAVLPVVQWLIKRVIATRQESGDQVRHSTYFSLEGLFSIVVDKEQRLLEEHLAQIEAEMAELKQIADAAGAGTLVPDLVILLNQSTDLELKEYQFRASCRKKRAELVTEIKQLQDPAHSVADDDEQRAEVEAAFNADLQKWISLRTELAQKSQEVALLQRKLDDLPCQTELIQYERRFVELYVHIQRKLRETRKYYATYNALAEAHELTVKETSLLNSIHSQFEAAMMTTGGRSKFVESMDGIVKGVKQKLDKVERRFHAEQSTYNLLKEKHASAVAAQRHYFSLVKLFQDECARSEKLRTALESFAGIATKDIPPSPLELKAHEQTFVSPL
ncbi:unnamed protein product [Sphagnum jensenii]|uniref:Coiled-coil domain-containing protein 93 n=1 Tax=Sphagnum jensenii TaxID=128206 RepID=A0ABP1AHD2_9BRYO